MSSILTIDNLNKNFDGFSLKNVSFSLERGFIMGFIGPNGAGKSTTIKLILNLLKRDSGRIEVFGLDSIKHELEIKNRIGFVFDENYFYEELTPAMLQKIIAPLYKKWDDGAFRSYISNFGLPKDKRIKELSKGMKMKLSLAVALSHQAELLIMDEPTSGLDPVVRSELLDILSQLIQDEKKSVFFSTHITSDLDKIADYITLIHDGQIVFSRAKDELFDQYAIVKGDNRLLDADTRKLFVGIRSNQFGFEGVTANRSQVRKILQGNVMIEKPTLEDIMVYHTRREQHA